MDGTRAWGSLCAPATKSSSARAAMTPSTRRGKASAPKPPESPSGIFSKPKVSAKSTAATAITAAAATRFADTLFQQAERFERFLAFDHELVELRLPGAGAHHAFERLPGALEIGIEHLALHGLDQPFLERLHSGVGRAAQRDEAAHGGIAAGHADLLAGGNVLQRGHGLLGEDSERTDVAGLELRLGLGVVDQRAIDVAADQVDHHVAAAAERHDGRLLHAGAARDAHHGDVVDSADQR